MTDSIPPELAEMLHTPFGELEEQRPNHDHVFVFDKLPREGLTLLFGPG